MKLAASTSAEERLKKVVTWYSLVYTSDASTSITTYASAVSTLRTTECFALSKYKKVN